MKTKEAYESSKLRGESCAMPQLQNSEGDYRLPQTQGAMDHLKRFHDNYQTGALSEMAGDKQSAQQPLDSVLRLMGANNFFPTLPNSMFTNTVNPFLYLQQLSELAGTNKYNNQVHQPFCGVGNVGASIGVSDLHNRSNSKLANTQFFKELTSSLDRSVSETECMYYCSRRICQNQST